MHFILETAGFESRYVRGYLETSQLATKFLEVPCADGDGTAFHAASIELATTLVSVLTDWGAGKRRAPKLQDTDAIASLFRLDEVRASMRTLAAYRASPPTIAEGKRFVGPVTHSPSEIDVILLDLLRQLADGLFTSCTNLTYPSKAAMLLTGFTVAVDTRVRSGAQNGGFTGMRGPLYTADIRDVRFSTAKKMTVLPYILGHAWKSAKDTVQEALHATGNKDLVELIEHPARVFDILFFMQGGRNAQPTAEHSPLIRLSRFSGQSPWYAID